MEKEDGLLPEVTLEFSCKPDDMDLVRTKLLELNIQRTDGLLLQPGSPINIILKNAQNQVIGGVLCDTFCYSMRVSTLWVEESHRKKGYGKMLLLQAERKAKEAGCTFSHTSTFSYQAPGFYHKQGYSVFGTLEGFPNGIKLYFLNKRL